MSNAKRRYRRRRRLDRNHPQCPECLMRDWHKMACGLGRYLKGRPFWHWTPGVLSALGRSI